MAMSHQVKLSGVGSGLVGWGCAGGDGWRPVRSVGGVTEACSSPVGSVAFHTACALPGSSRGNAHHSLAPGMVLLCVMCARIFRWEGRRAAHRPRARLASLSEESPLEFHYFGLWARIAGALCLEHSGLPWKYVRPSDWKAMKPECDWGCLPLLRNLPEACGLDQLSQEAALLDFVAETAAARGNDRLAGRGTREAYISKQLLGVGEDLYQRLAFIKSGLWTAEETARFWDKSRQDPLVHNMTFGIFVFLDNLEKFHVKVGGVEGRFTSSGCTIGECKLWASLHALKLIEPELFQAHPSVKAFYERLAAEPATAAILDGQATGGVLATYFVKAVQA